MPWSGTPEERRAKARAYNRARYHRNIEKLRAYNREWQKRKYSTNPEHRLRRLAKKKQERDADPLYCRKHHLKRKYGLTLAEFDRMLAAQNGACAICGTTRPGASGSMRIDHDHRTGRIRALLCDRCNRALGIVNDDVSLLQAAIRYLQKHALTHE